MNWNGVQIFGTSFHPYAMDVIHGHSQAFQSQALISMMDLQVFETDSLMGLPWLAWTPCDHHNIPAAILNKAKQADWLVAMSRHHQKEFQKEGLECDYIPCGVDTEIFKPLDRAACREEMKFPLDRFIVGMVAMNKGVPSRKAFFQNILAFAALQKKHGDCMLYLHTMDGSRGIDTEDLVGFCRTLGLTYKYQFDGNEAVTDVVFANQYGMALGYESIMMAKMYNSLDVLTSVTCGEGFGIPILEAQACGTPVIVGDWTSMPELCFSGWKVEKDEAEKILTPLLAWHFFPYAIAITDRMERAYQMRGNESYRTRARGGAQAYEVNRIVSDRWLPLLQKFEQQIKEPRKGQLARNLEVLR